MKSPFTIILKSWNYTVYNWILTQTLKNDILILKGWNFTSKKPNGLNFAHIILQCLNFCKKVFYS